MRPTIVLLSVLAVVLFGNVAAQQLPSGLWIEENAGQLRYPDGKSASDVLYRWMGEDYSILFFKDKFVYEYQYVDLRETSVSELGQSPIKVYSEIIEYEFVNPSMYLSLESSTQSKQNFRYSFEESNTEFVLASQSLTYRNAWDDIDIVFEADGAGAIKYNIIYHENASIEGARFTTNINEENIEVRGTHITMQLRCGEVTESIPSAWAGDARNPIIVEYRIWENGEIGFEFAQGTGALFSEYESMIIDPVSTIQWSTYFSDAGWSVNCTVKATAQGDRIYLAGTTNGGLAGIVTIGGTYTSYGEVFVACIDVTQYPWNLSSLVWCNVQGGPGLDYAAYMDFCETQGIVGLVGRTTSSVGIVTDGSLLNNGVPGTNADDGFLMYFDLTGAQVYGTYIGAQAGDRSKSISFDCDIDNTVDYCYVLSEVEQTILPNETGGGGQPFQVFPLGNGNAPILQQYAISGGGQVNWTTFYSTQQAYISPTAVEVDNNGDILAMFYSGDAPGVMQNLALDPAYPAQGPYTDYIIASFNPNAGLNWARWFGSPWDDGIAQSLGSTYSNIAVGPNNEVYLSGMAELIFGITPDRGYLARISNGVPPADIWFEYMPGSGVCGTALYGIDVSCKGTIVGVGDTRCTGLEFGGVPEGGASDGFVVEYRDLGSQAVLVDSRYLGGDDIDHFRDVSCDQLGAVYYCGHSESSNTSGISVNPNAAWQLNGNNTYHGFVGSLEYECCIGSITIPDGFVTANPVSYINETIVVNGTWYIEADVILDNCQVLVLPAGQILVGALGAACTLTANNTTFEACDVMWKGVVVTTVNSGVRLQSCVMKDAQYGIEVKNGTVVSAVSTEFVNNYVGLWVPPAQGIVNSLLEVEGCAFYTSGVLKPPYVGQVPTPSTTGFAGIDLNDIYVNVVSDPLLGDNIFHDLNYGIRSKDATIGVANARFWNIHPDVGYGSDPSLGSAIMATGYGGYFSLKEQGKGISGSAPNTFEDCRWGIWTEAMNTSAKQNKMGGPMMLNGCRVRYGGGRNLDVSYNVIDVRNLGIDLQFNDGATKLLVEENDITFGGGASSGVGISVREMNGSNANSRIHQNVISHRSGTTNALRSMRISAVSDHTVSDNIISLNNQSTDMAGIDMGGCQNMKVTCNSVAGGWTGNWGLSPAAQSGIRHSMGDNNRLSCNSVSLLRQGITFNGYSPATELEGNYFGAHDIGLLLTQGALIGPQVAKGNIWNGVSATWDAEWIGPSPGVVLANRIQVNVQNPMAWPSTWQPAPWFDQTSLSNFECATGLPLCDPSQVQGGGGERDQAMDEAVMQGIIQNGIYTDETQLTLAYELYRALLRDSTLYAGGAYTADFITLMAASIAEQLNNVEEPRKALYGLPPAVSAAVEQNEADIALLMDQIAAAQDQLGAGGLSPAQIAALEADIDTWKQAIETKALYNETAIANVDAAREVEAQLLESETGNIASTELIEQNAKAVNEIYLATIGRSGEDVQFDATQAATLLSIAGQCPLVGGNPVYQARSLYSLVDDQAEFEDALLCIADGYVVKRLTEPEITVTVYPNPNRTGQQFFEIEGLLDEEAVITVQLYDAQGRQQLGERLAGTKGSVLVSRLAQGLYHWVVSVDGRRLDQGKVTLF